MSTGAVGAGSMLAGRYRLVEHLARGGMGTVWRGLDVLLDRPVAIKEVRLPFELDDEARETLRRRTIREAQAAARLRHPAIVTVYDVVEQDDRPWIVMEYVPAPSMADVIRNRGPLPPARVAAIGLRVLDAMVTAQAAGVQHRDIKPANVLIDDAGRVVLTDFGIARHIGDETLTSAGLLVGSPDFLAPERARGLPTPGLAADLWSLGATMYQAVEGALPFDREGPLPTLAAVVMDEPPPMKLAGPLRPVIDGLLIKDPAHRLDADRTRGMLQRVVRGRPSGHTQPYEPPDRPTVEPGLNPVPLPVAGRPEPTLSTPTRADSPPVVVPSPAVPTPPPVVPSPAAPARDPRPATPAATGPVPTREPLPATPAAARDQRPAAPVAASTPAAPATTAPTQAATPVAASTAAAPATTATTPAAPPAADAAPAAPPATGRPAAAPAGTGVPEPTTAIRPAGPTTGAAAAAAAGAAAAASTAAPAREPAAAEPARTSTDAPTRRTDPPPPADDPAPDPRPAPSKRRLVLAGLLVLVLATLAGFLIPPLFDDDAPGTPQAGPTAATTAAAATAPATTPAAATTTRPTQTTPAPAPTTPRPTASPSGSAVPAPAGFRRYTDPVDGFSVIVPAGWRASRSRNTLVDFDDPTSSRFLRIDTSARPKPDPYQNWLDYEPVFQRIHPGYSRISIKPVTYRPEEGWTTADWEFRNGGTHVLDRNIRVSNSRAHAIYWSTPERLWGTPESRAIFELAAASFVPAPTGR